MFALWSPASASAACSGSSPTRIAASASRVDVGDCYAAAQNGDTILVPIGTAEWPSALTVAKDISIIGAGIGQTNISRSGECFIISLAHNVRISGFSFRNCSIGATGEAVAGKAFRVDHNSFQSSSWTINNISGGCANPQRHPTGLWDNNQFFNYAIHTGGSKCMRTEGNYQDQLWAQDPPFGLGDGVVYVEDNTFGGSSGMVNFGDGNYAARYVFRFNKIVHTDGVPGSAGYLEVHSVQGNNRAVQMWEVYKNQMTGPGSFFGLAFIRGGSGFLWGNRVAAGTPSIKINNVRSNSGCGADGTCNTSGPCNGTSIWDQNGQHGYSCRDQLGRAKDNTLWSTGALYTQPLMPAYFWDNISGTSTQYVPSLHDGGSGTSYLSFHIQENRDWYTQNINFNGTAGVGVGPIANRPASCTPGVAYWATDQGEWNSKQAGPDGLLYKCTAPNAWSVHYIPFTYPHPLQQSSTSAPASPLAPPTSLSATATQ